MRWGRTRGNTTCTSREADFFKWAEEKFKEVASLKRSEKAVEERVVKKIEEESAAAEEGFGAIFG